MSLSALHREKLAKVTPEPEISDFDKCYAVGCIAPSNTRGDKPRKRKVAFFLCNQSINENVARASSGYELI
jgi:hypothetical protein